MAKSEIAQFRQEQALREQAAQQGLNGVAMVASHKFITARMDRAAEHLLHLIQAGRHEEAISLMATPTWGLEEGKWYTTIP